MFSSNSSPESYNLKPPTLGSEAGVGEVVRLGFGLANPEFGFLRGVSEAVNSIEFLGVPTWKSFCFSFLRLALDPMLAVFVEEDDASLFFLFGWLSHVTLSVVAWDIRRLSDEVTLQLKLQQCLGLNYLI